MKMKMIKKNIAICYTILFFVGLITFKQNIVLLQKKEFIIYDKLIPKGFTSLLFNKNTLLYYFYVGLMYFIIDNIAIKTYKNLAAVADSLLLPSVILLSNNAESKVVNNSNVFVAFSLPEEKRSLFPFGGNGQETLVSEKKKGRLMPENNNEIEALKPLLFNYLITKNNQNGIGLDLKNSKLTSLIVPLNQTSSNQKDGGLGEANKNKGLAMSKKKTNLGNNSYNFNSSILGLPGISKSLLTGKVQSLPYYPLSSHGMVSEYGNVEKKNWYLSEDLIKLISAFFKSIYCIISKPKFINTPDKIIIEILYFITIPDYKIFKWYNFLYTGTIKNGGYLSAGGNNKTVSAALRRNKSIKLLVRKNNFIKKTLFNLNNTNITKLYLNKFIILFKLLSSYFKKPIEFNLIRLHKANYDSNILAQLFYLILKKKNIRSAIHNLYTKNKFTPNQPSTEDMVEGKAGYSIPAYISGLYIHIGGRLMREPIIPRKTTKKFEKGAIATGKVNFVDTARITKKNKKGAYTIKIAFAQNFMFNAIP